MGGRGLKRGHFRQRLRGACGGRRLPRRGGRAGRSRGLGGARPAGRGSGEAKLWFGGARPAARGSGGMLRWDARCRWSPSWPAGAASWPGRPAAMRGGQRARRGQSAKAPHSPGSGLPDGETHLPQARWKPDEARWGAATEPSRRLRTARGVRRSASAAARGMGGTREWPESDCPAARGSRHAAARRGVAARGARPLASAAARGMGGTRE